jgi:D-inositol-3-phosphate glycosyltransferase
LGFGNRVVHVPAGPERPFPKKQLAEYLPEFIEGVNQFATEKNIHYDLIHSHYWMSGLAAEALSELWQVPVVHMFHTLGEMKNRIATSEAEKEGAYRLDGERRVLAKADRIVAATLAELAQLQWLYKADTRKITVIPPGVDTCHFYPIPADEARQYIGIPKDDRMVLFVGRVEPLKGIGTLIQAMSCLRLTEHEKPAYLVIIGGEPEANAEDKTAEMARLQQLCKDLCLDQMVIFLGKRGQDTLPYYYSAAEVLVMPSLYESFGMVALEAMACGTPVIASQVGGLAFLVQDGITGFHVPDGDPDALCARLSLLLGDPVLRQKMGQEAANYARSYAWEKIAAEMIKVYEKLLQEKQLPHSPGVRSPT